MRQLEQKSLEAAEHDQLVSFAATRPDLPNGWVDQVMTKQRNRLGKTIEDILNQGFHERFARARDLAVEAQRGKLSLQLVPEAKDVEQMAGPYRAFVNLPLDEAQRQAIQSGSPIIDKSVAAAHAGQVIFEENTTYLHQRAVEIFTREITELWQQLRYIVQHTGNNEIEKSRIELAITRGLLTLTSKHVPFPVTKSASRDRAAELEEQLFGDFIRNQLTNPCPALSMEVLLKGVKADPAELPQTLDEQLAEALPRVRNLTADFLLDKWTSRVPKPDSTALRQRLDQNLKSGPDGKILESCLETCARDALRTFRESLASKELAAKWPGIANLSYEFDNSAINQLNGTATIGEAQKLPLLVGSSLRMEEAQKIFNANRSRLLEEGLAAVRKQVGLVRESARMAKYRQMLHQPNGAAASRKAVQAAYEADILEAWNENRTGLLAHMNGAVTNPDKYRALFAVTYDEIRNVLKDEGVSASDSEGSSGPGGGGSGSGGGIGDGIGPGSGQDGAGGAGATMGCQIPRNFQTLVTFFNGGVPLLILLVVLAGISVAVIIALIITYHQGLKNGARKALASN